MRLHPSVLELFHICGWTDGADLIGTPHCCRCVWRIHDWHSLIWQPIRICGPAEVEKCCPVTYLPAEIFWCCSVWANYIHKRVSTYTFLKINSWTLSVNDRIYLGQPLPVYHCTYVVKSITSIFQGWMHVIIQRGHEVLVHMCIVECSFCYWWNWLYLRFLLFVVFCPLSVRSFSP